jgi:EAL domain-containing protein (putative c-di-GMP-specific phosphodiesterase class I)
VRQAGDVIIEADIAMYQAKQSGRNTVRFFSPALQALAKQRASIEDELKKAIRNDQFFLAYQPQIEAGRVIGCEALIRWQNPSRGLVPPGEFIPIAEETGLILPIGQWVLQTACAQIAAWTADQSTRDIMLSVNVSARQFRQPGFVDDVLSALGKSGADAKNLKLELTETMLVDNVEDVSDKMNALKAHGLSFSLDDFGTGYSSLSSLKRLPFDQIKIDQSFIQDLPDDQESAVIVVTILALSQAMGLSAIAEGVETAEQSDFLAGLGCSAMQGYLHSRPLPPQDFEALLRVTNGARR